MKWEYWEQPDVPETISEEIQHGATFVAHNAEGFDAVAWTQLVGGPEPTWFDTAHVCRQRGLPAGLDRACKALGIQGKDEEGAKALKLLYESKIVRGEVQHPVGTVSLWMSMLRYNVRDVLIMRQLYDALGEAHEPEALSAHCRVNARGIPVDLRFASQVRDLWEVAKTFARDDLKGLTNIDQDDAGSTHKFKAWLRSMGYDVQSLERAKVQQMLAGDFFRADGDEVHAKIAAAIEARSVAVRATVGKVNRVMSTADPDSRCRGAFVYHGAHTGRFAGRDIQPHNMPRGIEMDLDAILDHYHGGGTITLDHVRDAIQARRKGQVSNTDVADGVGSLMRPVICAPEGWVLIPVDYAAVEARGVKWLARDPRGLLAFRDVSKDIYLDMASVLKGEPVTTKGEWRDIGKRIILGCGYGMAGPKFEVTAELNGVDLRKFGIEGATCVRTYRNTYSAVPRMWRELNRAALGAVETGTPHVAARCRFSFDGQHMTLKLPSGRVLTYRDAEIVDGEFGPEVEYLNPRGYRTSLYGGKITENVVQAFCRDFLVDAINRLDGQFPVVMHVHDEAVFMVREEVASMALETICAAMSVPPHWAADFPLRVEGFVSRHYRKGASKRTPKAEYMCGKKVS